MMENVKEGVSCYSSYHSEILQVTNMYRNMFDVS